MENSINKKPLSAFDRVFELQNDLVNELVGLAEDKLSPTETYQLENPMRMSYGMDIYGFSFEVEEDEYDQISVYMNCKKVNKREGTEEVAIGRFLGELDIYELCKLIDILKNNNFYIQK